MFMHPIPVYREAPSHNRTLQTPLTTAVSPNNNALFVSQFLIFL